MTFPSIILGIFIAAIPGNIFHFWRGGGFKWLVLYNVFAIIGFWIGHFMGSLLNLTFINLGMALIGSIVFLFGGYWLSMASVETKKK
jgi:hypothetical protein